MTGGDPKRTGDEAESSADERTGILNAELRGRLGRMDYATLDGGSSATGADRDSGSMSLKRRKAAKGKKIEEGKSESWWNGLVEKYGSVELENKGSVARDHLALGKNVAHTAHANEIDVAKAILIASHRTNVPRLAPYIPLLRQHRYRSHPALPPQR